MMVAAMAAMATCCMRKCLHWQLLPLLLQLLLRAQRRQQLQPLVLLLLPRHCPIAPLRLAKAKEALWLCLPLLLLLRRQLQKPFDRLAQSASGPALRTCLQLLRRVPRRQKKQPLRPLPTQHQDHCPTQLHCGRSRLVLVFVAAAALLQAISQRARPARAARTCC